MNILRKVPAREEGTVLPSGRRKATVFGGLEVTKKVNFGGRETGGRRGQDGRQMSSALWAKAWVEGFQVPEKDKKRDTFLIRTAGFERTDSQP
jgi:hypothetical protein